LKTCEADGGNYPDWPREDLNPVYDEIIAGRPDDPDDFNLHLAYQIKQMHLDPASMANTASQNAVVDYGVKIVMDALKAAGLDENTLVIYATDQADSYGQHGLYGHTNMTVPSRMYDTLMNVPFIVRQPGVITPNQVSDLMIGQYDILPTLLDFAGFGNVPIANTPGRSFAPYLINQQMADWPDEIYYEQEESRGIRTGRYAYWKRLKSDWKPSLFDIQSDPGQYNDLYGKSGYENLVAELDDKVNAFFTRYSDPQYDLWKQGMTKSYTSRTEHMDQYYGMNWQMDNKTKPQFIDTV
jgi:arylsulfatase A-like enzyme